MAVMPRPKGKGKQIAFAILGTPANMQSTRSKRKKKIDKRLDFEAVSFVR